ncbi:cellulase family glycosylhydrolase [Ohtaekwangia kribbensis]|jgi:endoglucanase|uniref:Cellulase family glycosylhydrolase n=1 Tax=Ohtaekwangia kribbensis TaxID=688913 RepID=A0ABW3KCI5_9BACT
MKKLNYIGYILIILSVAIASCSKDELNTLTLSQQKVNIAANGGTASFTVETDADAWSMSNSASDWLSASATTGASGKTTVTLTVNTRTLQTRTATLVFTAGSAKSVEVLVTQGSSTYLYSTTTDPSTITYSKAGGTMSLKVTTDASQWSVSENADWLEFTQGTGNTGATTITVTASANTGAARTATVRISAEGAADVQITVTQKGSLYPNYNTSPIAPDATGMNSNAVTLATKIKLGWNIGNTLEAIGGETAWGNPKVTKALIDLVKQNGFNAIRIPCSWDQYMSNSSTAQLKTDWLNRVKEVVQYCVDNDMYVLLNIHWDGGWLENNCTTDKQDANNAKQQAFWEQIATHLRDFDEHLLFASANEPNVENATQMAVLSSYHQTFVDAVRSTGGKNSYRVLIVQGPSTDIEKTNNLMTSLPTDEIADRLMAEVHFYTPFQFCLLTKDESWGKMFYYWGSNYHSTTDLTRNATWGEESTVDSQFKMMKTKFVDKGIPVIMGEYGAIRRSTLTGDALTLHLASRAYFLKYVTKQAKANGIIPFYWDAGAIGDNTTTLFNRSSNTVYDQEALDAVIAGITE